VETEIKGKNKNGNLSGGGLGHSFFTGNQSNA
jgi:hypothetical protein